MGKGWISAALLSVGDTLKLSNNTYQMITDIIFEQLDNPVTVYNFEVDDWHTYYVGNSSILVHNMCAKEFIRSPQNYKKVEKFLKNNGFQKVRQEGSHVIFKDTLTGKTFPVPNHGAKDIPAGTLRNIMKLAGLL